jgi:hypothetical protein
MYAIKVTALPSSTFGSDEPEVLRDPRLFYGFRTRTGRRAASLYGFPPEVVLYNEYRHGRGPRLWVNREVAETNLARLTERGYVAEIVVTEACYLCGAPVHPQAQTLVCDDHN